MNKLIKASFLAMGLSVSAFADTIPVNSKGSEMNPAYAGVKTCEITNSTGTNAVLCATGSGIILDVFASSVAATDTIVMRDSATANTTSTVLFSATQSSVDKALRIYPRFKNGLSVNALVAPTPGSVSRPNWTIVYTQSLQ